MDRRAVLVLGLLVGISVLSLGGSVWGESVATEVETAWQNQTPLGLSGVALAILERPAGGYLAYWMGGMRGMTAASSSDGLAWSIEDGFSLPPLEPDQMTSTNPWVFATLDGRFRMIYEIQDLSNNRRLYSAVSLDGLIFNAEGLVMAGGAEDLNPFDQAIFLSVPAGLRLADGSLRMYFVSTGDHTASALSYDDGLSWLRDTGFRVSYGVDPAIVVLPEGGLRMIYVDWTEAYRVMRILYADSADGLNFTYQGIIAATQNQAAMLIDPETIFTEDGALRLYYSYGSEEQTQIYTATAPGDWSLSLFPVNPPEGD
ncbi:MAG: hypothetical protein JRC92_09115 [Deltaproteobacteria bacterium]|nr:hypothetical protein [Deltaproteobacteria bacterium]